jgi:hypothetical protein
VSDIDVRFEPDADELLRLLPVLKERLEPAQLLELHESIEPDLFRYPAIDPPSFRARVKSVLGDDASNAVARR